MYQVFISPQVATIGVQQLLASSLSYVCTPVCWASRKFLRCYLLHNFPFVPGVSRAITSEPSKSEKQTLVANSTAFAWCLARLGDTWLVKWGNTDRLLVSNDSVKGVACKTRSEPLPSPVSLHGCRINTKSKKNVFTCTSGRQKRYLTMLAFLLYEQ